MADNRKDWEITYCLKFNFAASYLKAFLADGAEAAMLGTAYGTGDLRKWAQKRIVVLLDECEHLRDGRDLCTYALDAVRDSKEKLRQAGLFGSVQDAGITRTD